MANVLAVASASHRWSIMAMHTLLCGLQSLCLGHGQCPSCGVCPGCLQCVKAAVKFRFLNLAGGWISELCSLPPLVPEFRYVSLMTPQLTRLFPSLQLVRPLSTGTSTVSQPVLSTAHTAQFSRVRHFHQPSQSCVGISNQVSEQGVHCAFALQLHQIPWFQIPNCEHLSYINSWLQLSKCLLENVFHFCFRSNLLYRTHHPLPLPPNSHIEFKSLCWSWISHD